MKTEWGDALRHRRLRPDGKRALVVGAGNPAGRAIALALAQAGATSPCSSVTNDGDEMLAREEGSSSARSAARLDRRRPT